MSTSGLIWQTREVEGADSLPSSTVIVVCRELLSLSQVVVVGVGIMMGKANPNAFSILVGEGRRTDWVLAYLVGLPHHGSPLMCPTYPKRKPPSQRRRNQHRLAYIPHGRGEARWQQISGVDEPKRNNKQSPLDATLIHETWYWSHKADLSTPATTHHPKNSENKGFAIVPWLVRITNRVILGGQVG